jgi:hypothetical protein
MELGNQLDVSAALHLGNATPVPFTNEGGWALKAGLDLVKEENVSYVYCESD